MSQNENRIISCHYFQFSRSEPIQRHTFFQRLNTKRLLQHFPQHLITTKQWHHTNMQKNKGYDSKYSDDARRQQTLINVFNFKKVYLLPNSQLTDTQMCLLLFYFYTLLLLHITTNMISKYIYVTIYATSKINCFVNCLQSIGNSDVRPS